MKARGIRGGILLSIDADDELESVQADLAEQRELLTGSVSVEVASRLPLELVMAVHEAVSEAGGQVRDLRPPASVAQVRGENVILSRTVRSGGRIESTGSVVVLGDVNAGSEILAVDDIIVIGTLRGLAHAGAGGNEKAIIWAQRIRSPQLRIGSALAQADGDDDGQTRGAEVAHLANGQIVIRPWSS